MNNLTEPLEENRRQLLSIDFQLIELLNERALISKEIGLIKAKNRINIKQDSYWQEASTLRNMAIAKTCLNQAISNQIFNLIQEQSILIQEETVNNFKNDHQ